MGVGLKAHLPDGTYTATYRVISADTHIVYGGLVFNIGHAGAPPRYTVVGLIGRNESGEATKLAFGVVRSLDYLSIALLLGGLAFLLVAWRPLLVDGRFASVPEQRWADAEEAFGRRMRALLAAAMGLGVTVSVLGVLLQGASAAGVSLWSSLRSTVVRDTLESRFGEVWGLRAIDWLMLGALLLLARRWRARWPLAFVGLGAAYLAATPALAGHASVQSPTAVFLPSEIVHVLAASVWVGGVACLLLVLPAATRRLEGSERSRLLLEALTRFSPLALAAVLAIAVTGVVQAYIDVRSLHALLNTTYGALVLVKTALLLWLIGFGWINRARVIPALGRVVRAEQPPGGAGVLARRSLCVEMGMMLGVFGVTAALVGYPPPIDAASGPFSIETTLGPAELEMTVEPARVGLNTIHLYLIDAKDGTQFTATKELLARAVLPAKRIGPLALKANLSGPGHYTLSSAVLSPAGTWEIQLTDRVSEFEEYSRTVKVPIG